MTLSFLVPKTPEEKGEIDARSVYVGNVSHFFFFKELLWFWKPFLILLVPLHCHFLVHYRLIIQQQQKNWSSISMAVVLLIE